VSALFLHAKFSPQILWNVEKFSVEKLSRNFSSQSLLKSYHFHTLGCGEISAAALSEM